eukprot:1704275-Rhodomonas_salina.1
MAMSPAARALHAARLVILSTVIVIALNTSEVDGKNEFHVEKFLRERNEWLADSYSVRSFRRPLFESFQIFVLRLHACVLLAWCDSCIMATNIELVALMRLHVADEELDKTIAEFALAPDDSTVRCSVFVCPAHVPQKLTRVVASEPRDAKTLECKRQIVWTHKRHKAGQNPQHFQNSCPVAPIPLPPQQLRAQKGKGTQAPSRFAVLSVASEVELQRAKKIIEATVLMPPTLSRRALSLENKYRRGVQKMRQAYRFMLAGLFASRNQAHKATGFLAHFALRACVVSDFALERRWVVLRSRDGGHTVDEEDGTEAGPLMQVT